MMYGVDRFMLSDFHAIVPWRSRSRPDESVAVAAGASIADLGVPSPRSRRVDVAARRVR